jgi:hypothetical protein
MMKMKYTCRGTLDCDPGSWEGTLSFISMKPPYEAELNARGSYFHLLFGKHAFGNYLCIPNWGIGMELATLTDGFWNRERLCESGLSAVDACSVTEALAAMSEYINL